MSNSHVTTRCGKAIYAKIASVSGCVLPWVSETKYLGYYIVNSKSFKCSIDAAKRLSVALLRACLVK